MKAPPMNTVLQAQIIVLIESEWHRLPEAYRPFGAWIRRYSAIPNDATDLGPDETMPEAVWFLDKQGLRVENVWSWMRYVAMQRFDNETRHVAMQRFDNESFAYSPPKHPIGLAGFALSEDGTSLYSETQWGPRFGRGWRWRLKEGRLHGRDPVWVS